jgi:hypothetical protein
MSNENENESSILTDLVKSIKVPTDIAQSALKPTAKEIGDGFGNLFYLAFAPIQKARIKKEIEIQRFKEEIEKQLSTIPPENLTEPPLNIVGPALEASRYYIDYGEIRDMFAKLIANSMNIDHTDKTHSSFVEIIKQLSPLDARNFRFLTENPNIAVGSIRLNFKSRGTGGTTWFRNVFPFPEMTFENVSSYASSVDNLIRLGLLEVDDGSSYTDKTTYEKLLQHPFYKKCKKLVENHPEHPTFKDKILHLNESISIITDFGKNFAHCCL